MRWSEEQLQSHRSRTAPQPAKAERRREVRRKYGNRPTVVDGQQFDSQREAHRYRDLKLMESAGQITGLRTQVRYPLAVGGVDICLYVADFVYVTRQGEREYSVVEDVKSEATRTAVYRIKAKLMRAVHGIEIQEIL